MKKIHIAISTHQLSQSVEAYSHRLGAEPCVFVPETYALWRTDTLNLSVRIDNNCPQGTLCHLGWEDPDAEDFTTDTDVNGILWENFSSQQQADEINHYWPQVKYQP